MSRPKVLIVDDDKDMLRGLSIRLRAHGYNVVFAVDGISAISEALKEEPDVIILDIGLPGGDGFSVMERLGSLLPVAHIPIIILTARDISGSKERALNAGARAFLQKPVDNDVLLETLRKVLGEKARQTDETELTAKGAHLVSRPKVLILDDDKDMLRGLSIRLKADGYNVAVATDGISAISVALKEEPDAVILDIGLPGGDGFSVMERLGS
ncbi:MAG TPA: response regulator, partial [Dehalococcoidales bacterium]